MLDGGDIPGVLGGGCSILLGTLLALSILLGNLLALRRQGRYGLLFLDGRGALGLLAGLVHRIPNVES